MEAPPTDDHNTGLRVASFSCYLDAAKENNSLQKISPTKFVFNDPSPFTFVPQQPRKNGEISIFGADKYFSMKLDNYQMGLIKPDPKPVNPARTGSTPGAINRSQAKQMKGAIERKMFSGFGCKEPCCNTKDVHIAYYGSKPARTGSERKEEEDHVANIEEPRTSIEVFGSKTRLKGDAARNMERKLSILTWDAIPTSTVGKGTVCDDMASDASSDLFEIDSISVSHYAPSEASVQWRAVTADYTPSGCREEKSVSVTGGDAAVSMTNNNASNYRRCKRGKKEVQKSRINGGILGCRSLKAVEVAACNANGKGKHLGQDSSVSSGRSKANQKR